MYMWAETYSITNHLEVNRTEEVNILCPFATIDQCLLLRFLKEITIGMEVVVLLSDKVPEVCHLIKQRLLIAEMQDMAWNCLASSNFKKTNFHANGLKKLSYKF